MKSTDYIAIFVAIIILAFEAVPTFVAFNETTTVGCLTTLLFAIVDIASLVFYLRWRKLPKK